MIRANVEKLLSRVRDACVRSKRKIEEIQIVAVTKKVSAERILEACSVGLNHIGESRVQESRLKFQTVQSNYPNVQWHMIGHLQTNKINPVLEMFNCIQSVDSIRLAEIINQRASKVGKVQDCLAEVKVSEEANKTGLDPKEVHKFLEACHSLKSIRIHGLMCVAPYFDNSENARPYFAKVKEIFENCFGSSSAVQKPILSMGMSHDFEAAIAEGASMIRIGEAIFGSRQ